MDKNLYTLGYACLDECCLRLRDSTLESPSAVIVNPMYSVKPAATCNGYTHRGCWGNDAYYCQYSDLPDAWLEEECRLTEQRFFVLLRAAIDKDRTCPTG